MSLLASGLMQLWDAQIAATVQVLRRQDRQCLWMKTDASCEARLLPSVAPFEAGYVLGCTDCGNRAGLGVPLDGRGSIVFQPVNVGIKLANSSSRSLSSVLVSDLVVDAVAVVVVIP